MTIGAKTLVTRLLTVVDTADGQLHLSDGTTTITAASEYDSAHGTLPLVTAPDVHGTTLGPSTRRLICTIIENNPAAVVVRGGTELSRVLCSELMR
ncbi:hypothetical protein CH286_02430 [Rhodococcus sp. WWJCD1]|uniref:hypothetical protein n=1 Tax=Rhodococcus sp. WWJCD1 TaxID=2022519 RepID=UPI000B9ACC6A|nr:hypothetical protein [Rhodococcus sp. WWJCD1]OZC52463.1 hypothetical protein CH286_02430 [Rhodococcus sp. WWJCD1]